VYKHVHDQKQMSYCRYSYGSISPVVETEERDELVDGQSGIEKKSEEHAASSWLQVDVAAIKDILLGNKANVLLAVIPFGLCAEAAGWSAAVVFGLNFIAILPLAQLLGEFTEEVALHTNGSYMCMCRQ
jgi:hypothetical protein